MRYMLDTNICIYIIKNKPKKVIMELKRHKPSEVCVSAITYAELAYGVEKSMAVEKNRLGELDIIQKNALMIFCT